MSRRRVALGIGVWACLGSALAAAPAPDAGRTNAPFIRFVPGEGGSGQVQTTVRRFTRPDGVEVKLFSAVHVGDRAYYDELQRRFEPCDALLFELIREGDALPGPDQPSTDNPLSQLQLGMRRVLALEFQLEAIDYRRTNFVHADLDPDTFFRLQDERRESILGLMIRVMLEEQSRLNAGNGSTMSSFELLLALMNPDRAYALKLVLGRQMAQLEDLLAGIEQGSDGKGSVIVGARNEHAIKVLQAEIAKGRRRLGIFYGAGHMPDFQRRLEALAFEAKGDDWLTAWDIRARAPRAKTRPSPAPATQP